MQVTCLQVFRSFTDTLCHWLCFPATRWFEIIWLLSILSSFTAKMNPVQTHLPYHSSLLSVWPWVNHSKLAYNALLTSARMKEMMHYYDKVTTVHNIPWLVQRLYTESALTSFLISSPEWVKIKYIKLKLKQKRLTVKRTTHLHIFKQYLYMCLTY